MRVAIASDHAGFQLKEMLRQLLLDDGHDVADLGPETADRVDYPDFAHSLARKVSAGGVDRGVLVCGSGIGMAISANRHAGVRAANCSSMLQAELCRRHNNANVVCLGERLVGPGLADRIVRTFLTTDFEGGRHEGRVAKIEV
jgi:ribose 5-phosphate isomerase B